MSKTVQLFGRAVAGKYDKFIDALRAMSKAKPVNKEKFRGALEWHNVKFGAGNFEKLWNEMQSGGSLDLEKLSKLTEAELSKPAKLKTMDVKSVEKKLKDMLQVKFKQIKDAFHAFDIDNSGSITSDELRQALAKYNFHMSDEDFQTMMAGIDTSQDGRVTFTEFNKKYGNLMTGQFEGSYTADYHDKDLAKHNATVHARDALVNARFATADYVHKELEHIFESKFQHLHDAFKNMDEDHSGKLEPGEFKKAVERMANCKLNPTEYGKLCKMYNISPRQNIIYSDFVKDFATFITGSYATQTIQDVNDKSLSDHRARIRNSKNVALKKVSADVVEKKFAEALGNKFKNLRQSFKNMDIDNSGAIDEEEFRKALKTYNLELEDTEFKRLVRRYERDAAGRLTYKGFSKRFGPLMTGSFEGSLMADQADKERKRMLAAVHKRDEATSLKNATAKDVEKALAAIIRERFHTLRDAFVNMDTDNSGTISTKEFRRSLERHNLTLSDEQFKVMLKDFGIKGGIHGKFNYRDFEKNFSHLIKGKFEGHAVSELNEKLLKQHKGRVVGRQGISVAKPVEETPTETKKETVPAPAPTPTPTPAPTPAPAPAPAPKKRQESEKKKTPSKPKPKSPAKASGPTRRVLLDSLLDARKKLKKHFSRKNKRLVRALLAMDLSADGQLTPFELKRVLEQFKIYMSDSDFKKLIVKHFHAGRVNYVELAKGLGARIEGDIKDARKAESKDNQVAVLAEKKALREAESYLKDKLRNAYGQVLNQMEIADVTEPPSGRVRIADFKSILSRYAGCRLTKAELEAVQKKYRYKTRTFSKDIQIDYRAFSKLFDDLRDFVDMSDPETRKKVENNNKDAEEYLRDKLRFAYPKLLRAFKALETEGSTGMSYAAFKRLLSRFGGVRFTKDEWSGFVRKYDEDNNGLINFEELRKLFTDMIERDSQKVDEKKVFYEKQAAERKARKERAKAIKEKMRGALVDVAEVEQLLALQFRNNLAKAAATFKVLDLNGDGTLDRMEFQRAVARFGLQLTLREMDALMEKYSEGRYSGIRYKDFVNIISATQPKDGSAIKMKKPVIDQQKVDKANKLLMDIIRIKYTDAHKAFKHMDENSSGRIELEEFKKYLSDCNISLSDDETSALMDSYDNSGTRTLGFGDFHRAFGSAMTGAFEGHRFAEGHDKDMEYQHSFKGKESSGLSVDQLVKELANKFENNFNQLDKAFRGMDLDGSGKLDHDEFKRALSRFNLTTTEEQFKLLADRYDVDGDGQLSYFEFQKQFSKHIQGEFNGNEFAADNDQILQKHNLKIMANAKKAGVLQAGTVPFSPIRTVRSRRGRGSDGGFPPISARPGSVGGSRRPTPKRIPTGSQRPATRPSTSRSLSNAKRMALQRKLLAAEKKHISKPSSSRSGQSGDGAPGAQGQVDVNVYARWKKLRAAYVAIDKNRKGKVSPKAFVKVLVKHGVGRPAEIRAATGKYLERKGGVPYNDYIREIIAQFAA